MLFVVFVCSLCLLPRGIVLAQRPITLVLMTHVVIVLIILCSLSFRYLIKILTKDSKSSFKVSTCWFKSSRFQIASSTQTLRLSPQDCHVSTAFAANSQSGYGQMATFRERGSLISCYLLLSNWILVWSPISIWTSLIFVYSPFNWIDLSESDLTDLDLGLSSTNKMDPVKSNFNWYYLALSSLS